MVEGQMFHPGAARGVAARLVRRQDLAGRDPHVALSVDGAPPELFPVAALTASPHLGAAQRRVTFPDGRLFLTYDAAGVDALLGHAAPTGSWRRWAMIAAVATPLIGGGLWFGLPLAADGVASAVPSSWERHLGEMSLDGLDNQLKPSAASPQRRAAAEAAAARLAPTPKITLLLRKGGRIGANALALPGGSVVVTDELLELLADDPDALFAVLSHEQGHVHHRHGVRSLARSSLVALAAGALLGDVGAVASLSSDFAQALATSAYSRDFEREADAYAAAALTQAGVSPLALARALERLEKKHADGSGDGPLAYLSSHPATAERIKRLEKMAAESQI